MSRLYRTTVENSESEANNQCTNIRDLLNNFGFGYMWVKPMSVNHKHFHKIFKHRLIGDFYHTIVDKIDNCSVLIT